jgi:hypothetical protein
MGVAHLKERMRDVPGIASLTMTMNGGQQIYMLDNRVISLDASAADVAVEAAIRAAVASPAIIAMAAGAPVTPHTTAAAAAALHPSISANLLPPTQGPPPVTDTPSPATTPGAHAITIRDALADHARKLDQILQASLASLAATLDDQLSTVKGGTDKVISQVQTHTDEFKAILGQFSNLG